MNNNNNNNDNNNKNSSIINSTYTYYQSCSLPLSLIITILIMILIIGTFGNIIVILVLVLKRRMQSYANWLLLNLAVSDLLALVICIPLDVPLYIHQSWIYSEYFCNVYYPFGTAAMLSSVYTIVILNLSRYCRIVKPFGRRELGTIGSWAIMCGIWLSSVAMVVPLIIVIRYNPDEKFCHEKWDHLTRHVYSVAIFILGFAGPLTICMVGYISILWEIIIKVNRRSRNDQAAYRDTNMETENRTLVRLSVAVTVTFVMCVLPNQVVCLLMEFGDFQHLAHSIEIRTISHILLFLNSAVNPIVYNICSDNFRQGGRELIAQFSNRLNLGGSMRSTNNNQEEEEGGEGDVSQGRVLFTHQRTPNKLR